MAGQNSRNNSSRYTGHADNTYTQGNTVRVYEPARKMPQERPKAEPQAAPRTRQELEAEHERHRAAKRNARRAGAMNLPQVIFLTAVTAVFVLACLLYVNLQTSISGYVSSISSLESQIEELKSDNDAAESRIAASETISDIADYAGELGLVYPDSSQITYYSVDEDDYMNQYKDISER